MLLAEECTSIRRYGVQVFYGCLADHRAKCGHTQALIGIFSAGAIGKMRFDSRCGIGGSSMACSDDLCFVAPNVNYTASWEAPAMAMAIFLEPEILRGAIGEDYPIVDAAAAVAPQNDYVPHPPGVADCLGELWKIMASPIRAANETRAAAGGAFYAAIFLWQWHAWNLRIRRDGEDPGLVFARSWIPTRNASSN